MKKIVLIVALLSMLVVSMISCNTSSHCPAYGSVEVEQTAEKV